MTLARDGAAARRARSPRRSSRTSRGSRPSSASRSPGPASSTCSSRPRGARGALGEILSAGRGVRRRRGGHGPALPARVRLGQSHRARSSSSTRARPRWATRSRASSAFQGHTVETQYYVNDAGNQFHGARALVRGRAAAPGARRGRRAAGERVPGRVPRRPRGGVARSAIRTACARSLARPEAERIERARAPRRRRTWWRASAQVLAQYGTRFDRWSHEAADVRAAGLPERGDRGADRGGAHLRAGRRALVPLDGLRRRQGPRAPEVGRRADVLRGRHRLPPLRQVRRRRPRHRLPRARPPRLRRRASAPRCRRSAIRPRPSTCSSCSS